MEVTIKKLTDEELMRTACNCTFDGESKQSLLSMYKSEHSPARTQMFWVECKNIPLFVSTHLLRHHVGTEPFALTHRTDRHGVKADFRKIVANIQGDVAKLRGMPNDEKAIDLEHWILAKLDLLSSDFDRYAPTDLGLMLNAQSLIDMAKLRLCNKASKETREWFQAIKDKVAEVDPSLAQMMVRKCVYRNGICGERPCGFMRTAAYTIELGEYLSNFSEKQLDIN